MRCWVVLILLAFTIVAMNKKPRPTPLPKPFSSPAKTTDFVWNAKTERILLLTLAGIQFSHIVDFMLMMPLGPQFIALFHISDKQFGLLVSAYTFAAGAAGLLAAMVLDKFDRKHTLLVLYIGFGLATLACGLANTYETLMGARVLAGAFGGVLSALSQTMVADVVPFERRGKAMGIVMSAFSVSTVAGVPLSLLLATHFGWEMPFFAIAILVALFSVVAWFKLPPFKAHLHHDAPLGVWTGVLETIKDKQHWPAFAMSALLMFVGFTIIPFITIYVQTNVGWASKDVPLIYLCGGIATLISSRFIGKWSDKFGKLLVFRWMALVTILPMFGNTLMAGLPMWAVLLITTSFFIFVSGRMIPGMAMIGAAANPQLRGTFMGINSALQSVAMGLAALLGGHLIVRSPDAQHLVQNYWMTAVVGTVATLCTVWLAGKVKVYEK